MKKVVTTFGRMNPPTSGHQKLVDKINSLAKGADARVYLSHSQNNKKDPLDYNTKIALAQKAFGPSVTKSNAKTIIQVMQELQKAGYTDVTVVVGSDRVAEFNTLLNKYNGKDYTFDSIKVVSAGQRDPDADDVSGMSASKLRGLAKEGNFAAFKAGLPKNLQSSAKKIYDQLRSIMEQPETEEQLDEYAVLNLQQRMKRARMMKRIAKKVARMRKIRAKRMADTNRLMKRSRKKAIQFLRKRVAGERGKQYKELGRAEKVTVDKLVQKKSSMIDRLAKRLLPKVRKAEQQRVAAARAPKNEELRVNSYKQLMEVRQDPDIKDREGAQPAKYHSGLSKSTKVARDAQFQKGAEKSHKDPSAYPEKHAGDEGAKTRTSKHTKKYHDMFGEARQRGPNEVRALNDINREKRNDFVKHDRMRDQARLKDTLLRNRGITKEEYELTEDSKAALQKKAEKSGIPYSILKKVYDRGMAAWRTGHRPGAGQEQWAYARVNSFITKGKGTWGGADKDLAAKVNEEVDPHKNKSGRMVKKSWDYTPKKSATPRPPLRTAKEIADMVGIKVNQFGLLAQKYPDMPKPVSGITTYVRGRSTTYYEPKAFLKWAKSNGIGKFAEINETIKHEGDKWVIYSKDGSKKLGEYDTETAAKKRLRQIEFFKHQNEELDEACWSGYEQKGMKKKGDRMVPNCVKKEAVGTPMSVGRAAGDKKDYTSVMEKEETQLDEIVPALATAARIISTAGKAIKTGAKAVGKGAVSRPSIGLTALEPTDTADKPVKEEKNIDEISVAQAGRYLLKRIAQRGVAAKDGPPKPEMAITKKTPEVIQKNTRNAAKRVYGDLPPPSSVVGEETQVDEGIGSIAKAIGTRLAGKSSTRPVEPVAKINKTPADKTPDATFTKSKPEADPTYKKPFKLNELSPQTLIKYASKAASDSAAASKAGDVERVKKREAGIARAMDKEVASRTAPKPKPIEEDGYQWKDFSDTERAELTRKMDSMGFRHIKNPDTFNARDVSQRKKLADILRKPKKASDFEPIQRITPAERNVMNNSYVKEGAKEIHDQDKKRIKKDILPKSGAGQKGTDELVKNYVKDTPYMSIEENLQENPIIKGILNKVATSTADDAAAIAKAKAREQAKAAAKKPELAQAAKDAEARDAARKAAEADRAERAAKNQATKGYQGAYDKLDTYNKKQFNFDKDPQGAIDKVTDLSKNPKVDPDVRPMYKDMAKKMAHDSAVKSSEAGQRMNALKGVAKPEHKGTTAAPSSSPQSQMGITRKKFREILNNPQHPRHGEATKLKTEETINGYCPDTGELVESLVIEAAEYQGKKVSLNNPFRLPAGSKKKFGVYVKNDKGNVVKVTFGDPNMEIKRDDPERRKAFRSRHSCDDDIGPKWKARYWSCYQWRAGHKVDN